MAQPTWTDAEDQRLLELWRENKSMTAIANSGEFRGRTRNAIIGRIHRLRVEVGIDAVPSGKQGHRLVPVKKRQRKPNFAVKRPVLKLVEPTPEKIPPLPPLARQLSLLELGPKDCRFIVSGWYTRQHLYCAADASANADDCGNNCYCPYHRRLMRASAAAR